MQTSRHPCYQQIWSQGPFPVGNEGGERDQERIAKLVVFSHAQEALQGTRDCPSPLISTRPRFQHVLGQQCPNSWQVLSSAVETLKTFLWASWAMNAPGRLTSTCWDPLHLLLAFPGELGNRAAVPGLAPRQRLCLYFCPTTPDKSRSSSKEHMTLRQAAP